MERSVKTLGSDYDIRVKDEMINHFYYLIDTAKYQKKQALRDLTRECLLLYDTHEPEIDQGRHMGFCKRCGASIEAIK